MTNDRLSDIRARLDHIDNSYLTQTKQREDIVYLLSEHRKLELQIHNEKIINDGKIARLENRIKGLRDVLKSFRSYSEWNMMPEHEVRHELCCGVVQCAEDAIAADDQAKGGMT